MSYPKMFHNREYPKNLPAAYDVEPGHQCSKAPDHDALTGAERIVAVIRKLGGSGVTFVELLRELPEMSGDEIMSKGTQHAVIAFGVNALFTDAMAVAFHKGWIDVDPTSALTYMVDGFVTTMPLLTKVPASGKLKADRWLPVCWSVTATVPQTSMVPAWQMENQ